MRFDGIIFDFDGVLIESEAVGNRQIAAYLTSIGHPTTPADSFANFMGLSGASFIGAIERWIGRSLPEDFYAARSIEDRRAMHEGVDAVEGAVKFVLGLPADLPKAIASSSTTAWISRHLEHIGLREAFGDRIFSGKEHVTKGKPAPDIYLHAANALGVDIARSVIVEDSPVGATGAVASGARVIGFVGGTHCGPDHAARLRSIGVHDVAENFDQIAALIA
ncbi:MAG: HAD family phosphatase [Sphingomonas sp.]|uniref:HAD family hydrolase n=1 Tax=Sphingomonas sp. TaxID=28214 RepID=UPI003563DB9E